MAGVPQVSILGPLLFNIFVNDLFLFVPSSKLSNDSDDNTLFAFGYNLEEVKEVLLNDLNKVTEWFFENYMVLNAGKRYSMCLGKDTVTKVLRKQVTLYQIKMQRYLPQNRYI